jgi:hypothetical protein
VCNYYLDWKLDVSCQKHHKLNTLSFYVSTSLGKLVGYTVSMDGSSNYQCRLKPIAFQWGN